MKKSGKLGEFAFFVPVIESNKGVLPHFFSGLGEALNNDVLFLLSG